MNGEDNDRRRIEENVFFQRYTEFGKKECLFSDAIAAVAHLRQEIVQRATPRFIGRDIIDVMPTKKPSEIFPLDSKAAGYVFAEGVACRLSGSKMSSVTVSCDLFAEASEQWTKEFIEDTTPNVINNIEQRIADALAYDETAKILNLYGSVENGDLAGGAALDQGGKAMDWNAVLRLRDAVRHENITPTVLVLNETQLSQLLLDNRFIEHEYLPSEATDLEAVTIRQIVGMKVKSSTLAPAGTAYAINHKLAGVMLIRRDVEIDDWSDPMANKYGLKATTRFGLGILKSNAIAKMTNIKTTL